MRMYESILYTAAAELPLVPGILYYVVHSKVYTQHGTENVVTIKRSYFG